MAGLLVARCASRTCSTTPRLLFACAYGSVALAHIALFFVASRDDPQLRHSVIGLTAARRSASGSARRRVVRDGWRRARCGRSRSALDMAGPLLFGSEGWKLDAAPLRRASRADRDHRARRVDRRDRRRRRDSASTPASSRPPCSGSSSPRRSGGSTSTSSRSSPNGGSQGGAGTRAERDRARLLLVPALPDGRRASSWSPSGMKKTLGTSTIRSSSCPRSRCSAAPRSTCWHTSPFAGATSTRSTGSAWSARSLLVALSRSAVELPSLATLGVLAAILAALIATRRCASPSYASGSATSSRTSTRPATVKAPPARPGGAGGTSAGRRARAPATARHRA